MTDININVDLGVDQALLDKLKKQRAESRQQERPFVPKTIADSSVLPNQETRAGSPDFSTNIYTSNQSLSRNRDTTGIVPVATGSFSRQTFTQAYNQAQIKTVDAQGRKRYYDPELRIWVDEPNRLILGRTKNSWLYSSGGITLRPASDFGAPESLPSDADFNQLPISFYGNDFDENGLVYVGVTSFYYLQEKNDYNGSYVNPVYVERKEEYNAWRACQGLPPANFDPDYPGQCYVDESQTESVDPILLPVESGGVSAICFIPQVYAQDQNPPCGLITPFALGYDTHTFDIIISRKYSSLAPPKAQQVIMNPGSILSKFVQSSSPIHPDYTVQPDYIYQDMASVLIGDSVTIQIILGEKYDFPLQAPNYRLSISSTLGSLLLDQNSENFLATTGSSLDIFFDLVNKKVTAAIDGSFVKTNQLSSIVSSFIGQESTPSFSFNASFELSVIEILF